MVQFNSNLVGAQEEHLYSKTRKGFSIFVVDDNEVAQKSITLQLRKNPNYDVYVAKDNEELTVGKVKIRILHTPGHTMESTCFLLLDETDSPHSVFTGDTLFIGDVGRPDLLGGTISKEDLAAHMYDSLNNKIKTLPDEVVVYPGHGPGSSCGKNLGTETTSTIGQQKMTNYALQDMTKEEFVKAVTDGVVAGRPVIKHP